MEFALCVPLDYAEDHGDSAISSQHISSVQLTTLDGPLAKVCTWLRSVVSFSTVKVSFYFLPTFSSLEGSHYVQIIIKE